MNTWFQFKQFIIHQDKCAMKVTEIACIQGAWTKVPAEAKSVLDIGCGTGLLSLMIAQKYPTVKIDAIEIDEPCFEQAKKNIENSVFNHQIHCIHGDIKTFAPAHPYDFIISNPPFFEHQLKSPVKKKNTAWHSDELSLTELIHCIDKLLKQQGSFSIVLPASREDDILNLCRKFSFSATRVLQIRHSVKHPVAHKVFIFSRSPVKCQSKMFTLKEDGKYSAASIQLLDEFYLKL